MKKMILIFTLIFFVIFITGCSTGKVLIDPKTNSERIIENYGIFNTEEKYKDVVYRVSPSVVFVSIIFIETIIIPFWLIGWELYSPVRIIGE